MAAAQVAHPDPINGNNGAGAIAHRAIDIAFERRIADLYLNLLRDAQTHHEHVTDAAVKRFNTGYRLAAVGRVKAHELIDQM